MGLVSKVARPLSYRSLRVSRNDGYSLLPTGIVYRLVGRRAGERLLHTRVLFYDVGICSNILYLIRKTRLDTVKLGCCGWQPDS